MPEKEVLTRPVDPGATVAATFAEFRFKPGDLVIHRSAVGKANPFHYVVLNRQLVEEPCGAGRVYGVRGMARDGNLHLLGDVHEYLEWELDAATVLEWHAMREDIKAFAEAADRLRREPGPSGEAK